MSPRALYRSGNCGYKLRVVYPTDTLVSYYGQTGHGFGAVPKMDRGTPRLAGRLCAGRGGQRKAESQDDCAAYGYEVLRREAGHAGDGQSDEYVREPSAHDLLAPRG